MKLPSGLPVPNIHPNSLEIMKRRHLKHDEEGNVIEKPKEMFWRVANSIGTKDLDYGETEDVAEATSREFYTVMAMNEFLPGSRVLFEAGNNKSHQLSSCFVLPIEDSLEGIFETMKDAAIVQKNNGGTGFNFSKVRPKGDMVNGVPNVGAGPVHFIRSFSVAFDQILQGMKRGGGNMAILNIDHPDIMEFINMKGTDASIRNFNTSIGITNKFMQAVKDKTDFELINPRTGYGVAKVDANELFDIICQKAWECADPGLAFIDEIQDKNPTKDLGVIDATNPCGEEPLRPYESCNLGSIVLPTHVINGEINWDKLAITSRTATHFLENMIDASHFPLQKIQEEVTKTRKLGVGIVGLGQMFYMLKLSYNSQEAVTLCEKIIAFIQEECTKESEALALKRGVFPGFKNSKWDQMGRKVRNATMTSIAPTGTLSLVANTSSGMEPVFSLVYIRKSFYQDKVKSDQSSKETIVSDPIFEEELKRREIYSEELMRRVAKEGTIAHIDEIPSDMKKIFVTTHDISPEFHVRMQAAAQKNVDAAVSKTINMPHTALVEDVKKAYLLAWELKCKGTTIYRDGSKGDQVLSNA